MPLDFATRSIRYTQPRALTAALWSGGPGRAMDVLRFYQLVEGVGGRVWDFDLKYAHVDAGVEVPEGKGSALWNELVALIDVMEGRCEACSAPGSFRSDLLWFRVLCDDHYAPIRSGKAWREVYAPFWRALLPERPDLWPSYARDDVSTC